MNRNWKQYEIAYFLGFKDSEYFKGLMRNLFDQDIEILCKFVDGLVKEFDKWQEGKNNSELQLLHDFLDEVFENDESLDLYINRILEIL